MSDATLLEEARRLLAAGDAAAAAAKADEALAAGAARADALRVKAAALMQIGRPADAEHALRELSDLRPDDPWAYVLLGRLHLAGGRVGKAQAMAERAMALDPDSAETRALHEDLVRAGEAPAGARSRRKKPVAAIVAAAIVVAAFLLWWFLLHARAGAGVQQAEVPGPGQPPLQQVQPQGPAQPQVTEPPPGEPAQPPLTQGPPEQPAQPTLTQAPGRARLRVARKECAFTGKDAQTGQGFYHISGEIANDGAAPAPAIVLGFMYSVVEVMLGAGYDATGEVAPGAQVPFSIAVASTRELPAGADQQFHCKVVVGENNDEIRSLLNSGEIAAAMQAITGSQLGAGD